MGTDTVEISRGEDVTEASVAVPEELWVFSGDVLPAAVSGDDAVVGTSDVVGVVLVTGEVEGMGVLSGVEIPWDLVSVAAEPVEEYEGDGVAEENAA